MRLGKAGTKSEGVARQDSGQVGKSSNGQAGVFAARCRGNSAGLVGGHLSFPEAWRKDATRCAQARRPVAQRASRSKPALAQALVEHLLGQGLVRAEWVGGDAASGNSPTRRQALQQRQRAYVLDVGPAGQLHLPEPTPASAPPWAGRPPRPPQPVGSALALPALAAPVPAATWQGLPYRPGQKGPLVRQAVLLPVWRWEQAQAQALELLISRALDGTQLKYSLGYTPRPPPWRWYERFTGSGNATGWSACCRRPSSKWGYTRASPAPGWPGSTR